MILTEPDVASITVQEWRDQVIAFARHRGWLTHWTEGKIARCTGFPSVVFVRSMPGGDRRVVFAQLYSATGKVTAMQAEWLHGLAEVGAFCGPHIGVFAWRPSDWPAVRKVLL